MRTALRIVVLVLVGMALLPLLACRGRQGETIVGPQGSAGVNGSNGSNGTDGADGQQGLQGNPGLNGQDGTQVTVVKLCPGVTTYPSVFVEVALCLNNKLYGVYSANNGFLVELPPGNYSSNAIGSACNLTILPNCQVQ